MLSLNIVTFFLVNWLLVEDVGGHGYLIDPAGRSSLWRHRIPGAPINYDDNGLNCGGFSVQWETFNGSCGTCGDSLAWPQPRDNEAGGKYGKGIIAATYNAGKELDITLVITANHYGWFEFRLCPNNDISKVAPQSCFNKYLLELADGSGTRYYIPTSSSSSCTLKIKLKLPEGLLCSQCVL